ncbi:hypothetical protein LCGC14_0101670 [marine sediment metagenome]|uniref:Uncharacterized protein n=1 Tax=marine sediment metagenome TaxID=412755 RepID=A0A0F9VS01_9ZZZZ
MTNAMIIPIIGVISSTMFNVLPKFLLSDKNLDLIDKINQPLFYSLFIIRGCQLL